MMIFDYSLDPGKAGVLSTFNSNALRGGMQDDIPEFAHVCDATSRESKAPSPSPS